MYGKARLLGSNGQYSRYPLEFFTAEMGRLGLHLSLIHISEPTRH